ncbi:MFS transporter [Deinococcus sp.]|uniref:MFS transporter n=1 Tax=Deinococcus sp. TaxID=47478 RepID=UPI003B5BD8EB
MSKNRAWRLGASFALLALGIEFLDELVDGVSGAAWPLIRADLKLSYTDIGVLLTLPGLMANLIEPLFGLLADAGRRRALILGGGLVYAAALGSMAVSGGFWTLLAGLLLYHPAAGAFVSLTQAAWMDADPARREHNMARWTLAGSLGNVVGPLLIGAAAALHLGWRFVFVLLAALFFGSVLLAFRARALQEPLSETEVASPHQPLPTPPPADVRATLREALAALRRGEVRTSLWLLECGNLMLDVFRGLVGLYFVDVVGTSAGGAALATFVLTGVGLIGDALLLPLLGRVSSLRYLRLSAALSAALFPAFLLLPGLITKLALLGAVGFLNAGWYAILQARLYASLPGRSGVALALGNLAGLLGGLAPLLLGVVAERFGLTAALWLLLLGPLALLRGLPAPHPRFSDR